MKVSILIPFYNAAPFLAKTIRSALDQSYLNKEIILINDGSMDDSLVIAQSFASKQVKVIDQPNSGACVARNKALAIAQGEYIQYLDADDLLSPDKIRNQVQLFREYGNNIIVSSRWARFYGDEALKDLPIPERFLDRDWNNTIDWLINSWEGKGMGQTSLWLSPRALLEKAGPWNEQLLFNQDGEYFCRVLLAGKAVKFCRDAIVYYRSGNTKSITGQLNYQKACSHLLSYELYCEHVKDKYDLPEVRHALMRNYLSFIYDHYDNYPDLVKRAKQHIKELGFNKLEPTGGKKFLQLAKVIGFENALKLRGRLKKWQA